MLLASLLLFCIGVLGAVDILLYHSISHGIRDHPDSKTELIFHSLRGPTYAALFVGIPHYEFHGWWGIALIALLTFDIGISVADFWVEEESRRFLGGLPSGEYVLHMLIAMLFGAFVLAVGLKLPEWIALPTALVYSPDVVPFLLRLTFLPMALMVFLSGAQDLLAIWKMRNTPFTIKEPIMSQDSLDIRSASLFLTADPEWRRKVFLSGLVLLIPVVGWPALLGYRKGAIENIWSGAKPLLPEWKGMFWHHFIEGVKCCAVIGTYGLPVTILSGYLMISNGLVDLIPWVSITLFLMFLPILSPLALPTIILYLTFELMVVSLF